MLKQLTLYLVLLIALPATLKAQCDWAPTPGVIETGDQTSGCGQLLIDAISSASDAVSSGNTVYYRWQKYTAATGWVTFNGNLSFTSPALIISVTTKVRRQASCDNFETPENTSNSNEITYTINPSVTTANAGVDQTKCGTTVTTLAANAPTVGTGRWSIVSGTGGTISSVTNRTSTFSGTAGSSYTLRWTITNGTCSSIDDVIISFPLNPTAANAGPDQALCNVSSTVLAANTPSSGTGSWSFVSGGGAFSNASIPTSNVYSSVGSTLTLRWTITTPLCGSRTDDVVVKFLPNPEANAGTDQTLCNATTATLNANIPASGSGKWTILSGTGTFSSTSSPNATFTGIAGNSYTLRWTVTSECGASVFDDVYVSFPQTPVANAGVDQSVCNVDYIDLNAVRPNSESGSWSYVSGHNGYINSPTNPNSRFYTGYEKTSTLRWTVTNSCGSSYDDVVVSTNSDVSATITGGSSTICYNTSPGTFTAVATGGGPYTYSWYKNGTAQDVTTSTYSPGNLTTTTTIWCVVTGACGGNFSAYQSITVIPQLTAPGTITGPTAFEPGTGNHTYSIAPVANTTMYSWVYNGQGATITGSGTSVTINFASNATGGELSVRAINACETGPASIIAITTYKKLELTSVLIEGLFDAATGNMKQARTTTGPKYATGIADQIKVELHDADNYNNIAFTANNANLETSGKVTVWVPVEFTGYYYITVKHRNSIETTTSTYISFGGTTISQSFGTPVNVYGGNLLLKNNRYLIYSGDNNNDGMIDLEDMNAVEADVTRMYLGYLPTDINGDAEIDLIDLNLSEANVTRIIARMIPVMNRASKNTENNQQTISPIIN